MVVHNIFSPVGNNMPQEVIESLHTSSSVRVERIVSRGHCSPENFWYDQESDEWVILLTGEARLLFAEPPRVIYLRSGDYLFIPAHTLHRVQWTAPGVDSIWLAVHIKEENGVESV